MERKARYGFQTPAYGYAALEHGLARMLGVDSTTQEGALRGSLKRLLVLGLPPAGAGKGSRRLYSWEEATQLGVALLLEDADVEPVAVVRALQNTWRHLANKVRPAADCPASNPMMLTIRLTAKSGPWRTGDPVSAMPWITIARRIDERARERYRKHGFKDESDTVLMQIDRNEPGWVATTNLTAALSKLQAALHEEVH
jgi:hypothetical protein